VICIAPGCTTETASEYEDLCRPHVDYVEKAMADHKDRLLWDMPEARQEVDAWLASAWSRPTEWVIVAGDWTIVPAEQAATDLAAESGVLGFVDPRLPDWWREHGVTDRSQSPWLVAEDGAAMTAWRAHIATYLKKAIEEALCTFPAHHAGREIKAALLGQDGYAERDAGGAIEEITEGYTGLPGAGLSDDADSYLRLRYEPDPSYLFSAELPSDVWFRHRVLPADVMAILEAVRAHEAGQEVDP
jgi:hypothetical protein